MPQPAVKLALCVIGIFGLFTVEARGLEIFAKGSYTKNSISDGNYTTSIAGVAGLAFALIPRVRLELRYTSQGTLQDSLNVGTSTVVVTLNNVMTLTTIYSAGVDIDILGPKSSFQPFFYLGAGYLETVRSYYYTLPGLPPSDLVSEPPTQGISANGGAGFRLRLAERIAFEVEAFVYALNVQTSTPTINYMGTAGFRLYL